MKRVAVIMAGGAGERFWPVSRASRPKQLLRLAHPQMSLLEEAVHRVEPLFGGSGIFAAIGKSVEGPVRDSGLVPPGQILVEPAKRNTLGCLCWAAAQLSVHFGDDVTMAVLTADHRIGEPDRFRARVELAMAVAESEGALVTIGMPPDRPETGFGYIETDPGTEHPAGVFRTRSFREKPDRATAEAFLAQGGFYWNGGMVFATLPTFFKELEAAQPEAFEATRTMIQALGEGDAASAERAFETLPNISVDYALLEKSPRVMTVVADFPWDDVGSWDALERSFPADEAGNVAVGDVICIDAEGNIVYSDADRMLVGIVGLKDVLVVVTPDAVLVCPKKDAQRVKEIVAEVKSRRPELT